jgi:hypothetical protein
MLLVSWRGPVPVRLLEPTPWVLNQTPPSKIPIDRDGIMSLVTRACKYKR